MDEDTTLPADSPESPTTEDSTKVYSGFLTSTLPSVASSEATALGAEVPTVSSDNADIAVHAKPKVDSQGRFVNLRSCVTCRRRKVKCDKTHPCANCNRARIECVFPSPGRAPRKVRKPTDGRDKELMERLRRLEGVVKSMGVGVPNTDGKEIGSNASSPMNGQRGSIDGSNDADTRGVPVDSSESVERRGDGTATKWHDKSFSEKTQFVEEQRAGRFENRFGRLVVNEGRSRYINNSFWANLSNEVEDLKGILNQSSDDEEATPPMDSEPAMAGSHHGWVFGFSSTNVDLLSLHPLPSQIPAYWDTFKDRVDPLAKVLHMPTTEPTVLAAASQLSTLSKGFEALLFSIYYGATTSLSAAECQSKLGEEKTVLLSRYRFAIEQALARANFLTTEESVVLQAFVIFLICLRRNNDARVIWTLTGLIVRIAQTIGIHRDGSHFGLPPFEIEMRRRLWWQVCVLDTRASEDHGCDPTILEQAFDTKLPLNINDVDISPDAVEFPPERIGCTDMSFCLIRFEVGNTFRRLNYIPPGQPRACGDYFASVSLADKEQWIADCHRKLEEKYLKDCDMSVPIYWVTATVARLMMSKMWLMVYHPLQRQDGGANLSKETREKLFITSLENIEYSLLLETEARTMKWGWLFKTYMQWHALAFLLSALCTRTTGDLVDRAWVAVDKTHDGRWGVDMTEESRAGRLWRPLKKLYRKAREARQQSLRDAALAKQSSSAEDRSQHTYGSNTTDSPQLDSTTMHTFDGASPLGQISFDKQPLMQSTSNTNGGKLESTPEHTVSGFPSGLEQGSGQDFAAPGTYLAGSHNNDFAFYDQSNSAPSAQLQYDPALFGTFQNNAVPVTSTSGFNSTGVPADLSMSTLMDTSGDMNWEDWDQLVREFGMEVDGSPNGGLGTNWAGDNWDLTNPPPSLESGATNAGTNTSAPAGIRRARGMGMGDLF